MRLPDALPDELLFSRLIRYCLINSVPIPQFLSLVYGDHRASINPILTTGLNSLSSIFAEDKGILLREQTLAPLFMYYYPHYRTKLEAALFSTNNYTAIRLSQLSCVREHSRLTIKMCPQCVRKDIRQFGVAYWHRVHQIPSIESCCEHQQQLVHVSLTNRLKLSVGLPLHLASEDQGSSIESFLLAGFAKQILLKQSKDTSSFNSTEYREKLISLGYTTKCHRIRRKNLLSDFCQYTKKLHYPFSHVLPSSDTDYKYITNLVYAKHSQHIFKHLVFGYWLSRKKRVKAITDKRVDPDPTQSKQLRLECLSLLKPGLSISAISKQMGKSRTYVKGVAYAHGLDNVLLATKLTPSVRVCIISLAWRGFHRSEIARRALVSTGSVEILISSVSGLVEWRKQCKYESKRRRYKYQILKSKSLFKIRQDIKRDCNAAFFWLYRHEPDWLESMLPKASHPHLNPRTTR